MPGLVGAWQTYCVSAGDGGGVLGDGSGGLDGGSQDSASADAGRVDPDAGVADTGPATATDTGGGDAGVVDGGALDGDAVDATSVDTGKPDSGSCGDGVCSTLEGPLSCPQDCGSYALGCGNGACEGLEDAQDCPIDCEPKATAIYSCLMKSCKTDTVACLKDVDCHETFNSALRCIAICQPGDSGCVDFCIQTMAAHPGAEKIASCGMATCKSAAPGGTGGCGDGLCQPGESYATCPADCDQNGPICGDGQCAAAESPTSCPADCKPVSKHCGDTVCGSSETDVACPVDCQEGADQAWGCMEKNCPNEAAACIGDAACGAALNQTTKCLIDCGGGDTCVQKCQGPVVGNSKALSLALCAIDQCPVQ